MEKSLEAWKAGQPQSVLAGSTPSIIAVDHEWAARKSLTAFVIGESAEGQGSKSFAVSITLKGSPAKGVHYMVFGRDPIYVYRDDDFARMSNMENGPPVPKLKK